MGVASSSSFPGARHFGVMHFQKKGGMTITDSQNICEEVSTIYYQKIREEESRLLSWGSFPLLLLVIYLGNARESKYLWQRRRRNDHHPQSKYLWLRVHHILSKYQRGRIPIVVVGVASRSLMSARYFDVMHSGMKGGANITDGWIYPRGIAHHIHHMRWEFSRKTWQTESQPVLNSDLCVEFLVIAIDL